MKSIFILLIAGILSCTSEKDLNPNSIQGEWKKLTNPNIKMTFDYPNVAYDYLGNVSYYTYSLSGDTVVFNNNGNVTKRWFIILNDTLRMESGGLIEKWHR